MSEANDALQRQIAIIDDAIGMLSGAIASISERLGDKATWVDVSRHAHLADAARRFVETIEESAV